MNSTRYSRNHYIYDKNRERVGRGRNNKTLKAFEDVKIQDSRRPVYAVLSEPMKSNMMQSQDYNLNTGGYLTDQEDILEALPKRENFGVNTTSEKMSYIPKAHV